jgi:benzoyl-CoA reductase/2-hydroxyglutaryl-CoA dehydratase subunit BcrC/BadD/HgdB
MATAGGDIPDRKQTIARHRKAGGAIAAVFPIHYPRALLRAFDLLPVEVWGPPGRSTTAGDAHLQAYTCSIVRCSLSFVLEGKLDDASVLLLPHACDSLQGLGSTLLDFTKPSAPVQTLYIPRGRRKADTAFLAAEIRRLHDALVAITDREPGDERLSECIQREEAADLALKDLLSARPSLGLNNRDFYRLVRSREYLPCEEFEPLVRKALDSAVDHAPTGPRIILSGLVPEPMSVLDALDEAGVLIVGDDLASSGRRLYPAGRSSNPFERMAESLQAGPPDSTRGCPVDDRLGHLLELSRRTNAAGVIYFVVKFCEPEQFYIPQLNQGLAEAGIKTLSLEVDIADPLPDQLVTRLEAFAETL